MEYLIDQPAQKLETIITLNSNGCPEAFVSMSDYIVLLESYRELQKKAQQEKFEIKPL